MPEPARAAFLSYHWHDAVAVQAVHARLSDHGLTTFIDREGLTPGKPWQPELEAALGATDSCVVFVGPHGFGEWQQREVMVARDRISRGCDLRIVVVLLPEADPPLGFLGSQSIVDLRGGTDDSEPLGQLLDLLRPEGTESESRTAALTTICPYRGLRPFREEDAAFFFGRDHIIDTLEELLSTRPFVAVVGPSGSGKSSIVRSGLAARLRTGVDGSEWTIRSCRPGSDPQAALTAALDPTREPGNDSAAGRILLIVDQWEELYTHAPDPASARTRVHRFVDALATALNDPRIRCVLTVRADFYGHLLESRLLADRLQDAIVYAAALSPADLTEAIERPALAVGLTFEAGLVDRIVDDVGDEPGNLPLLEYVLTRLWERSHAAGVLGHDAYAAIGGLEGAIAKCAESLLDAHPDRETNLRRIFGRLVVIDDSRAQATRRRAAHSEFAANDRAVIRDLVAERLVVVDREQRDGEDPEDGVVVEIAHEALIRSWRRLRRWIDDDNSFLGWRRGLRSDLDEYRRTNCRSELLTGHRLHEARGWFRRRGEELAADERSFVERSHRRSLRTRASWVATVALIGAALLTAAILAEGSRSRLDRARGDVETARSLEARTTDPLLVPRLIARARGPWPWTSSREAAPDSIATWQSEAHGVLARAAEHRAWCDAPQHGTGPVAAALRETLNGLDELEELVPNVTARASALTPDRWEHVWAAFDRDMAARATEFGDLAGMRSAGLIPLGRELRRTLQSPVGDRVPLECRDVGPLWVFAIGGTGEIPDWDGEPGGDGRAAIRDDSAIVLTLVPGSSELPPFLVARTEVTNHQYRRFVTATGHGPSPAMSDDDFATDRQPVVDVTWYDADAFCAWAGVRLPSTAEWEYTALAGATAKYWTGARPALFEAEWCEVVVETFPRTSWSHDRPKPVATRLANPWGLSDVHGNVAEWCAEDTGFGRAVRGGGCRRSAHYNPVDKAGYQPGRSSTRQIGFRVVRSVVLRDGTPALVRPPPNPGPDPDSDSDSDSDPEEISEADPTPRAETGSDREPEHRPESGQRPEPALAGPGARADPAAPPRPWQECAPLRLEWTRGMFKRGLAGSPRFVDAIEDATRARLALAVALEDRIAILETHAVDVRSAREVAQGRVDAGITHWSSLHVFDAAVARADVFLEAENHRSASSPTLPLGWTPRELAHAWRTTEQRNAMSRAEFRSGPGHAVDWIEAVGSAGRAHFHTATTPAERRDALSAHCDAVERALELQRQRFAAGVDDQFSIDVMEMALARARVWKLRSAAPALRFVDSGIFATADLGDTAVDDTTEQRLNAEFSRWSAAAANGVAGAEQRLANGLSSLRHVVIVLTLAAECECAAAGSVEQRLEASQRHRQRLQHVLESTRKRRPATPPGEVLEIESPAARAVFHADRRRGR